MKYINKVYHLGITFNKSFRTKKIVRIVLLILIFIICLQCSNGQFGVKIKAQDAINELDTRIKERLDQAIRDGDIVLESNLLKLALLLENLEYNFSKDLTKNVESINQTFSTGIEVIGTTLEEGFESYEPERLNSMINSDLQIFCRQLSFIFCNNKELKYGVNYVGNNIQKYNSRSDYYISFGGSAFNIENDIELIIDGHKITDPQFEKSTNFVKFRIPNDILRQKFMETKSVSLDYKLIVTKKKFWKDKELLNIDNKIILLPIYPLKYELTLVLDSDNFEECENCSFKIVKKIDAPLIKNIGFENRAYTKKTDYSLSFPALKDNQVYSHISMQISPDFFPKWKPKKKGGAYYWNSFSYQEPTFENKKKLVDVKYTYTQNASYYRFGNTADGDYKREWPKPFEVTFRLHFLELEEDKKVEAEGFFGESASKNDKLEQGYLTFGDHLSKNLPKNYSGFILRIFPYYEKNLNNRDSQYMILTPRDKIKEEPNFFKAKVIFEPEINKLKLTVAPLDN